MKTLKKIAAVLTVLVLCVPLCSCKSFFSDNDTLITPPTLFKEQDKIMKALYRSVGENITLEYPKTGENRSAFVMCDIDRDLENEVLAFYRPKADGINQDMIHINLLDDSGKNGWVSMCDTVGKASGIDRVSIGVFGSKTEVIIGWELMADREKTLACYSLSNKSLVNDYTATYVEFAVADFWKQNEGSEIITLNYSSTAENLTRPTQHARLLSLTKNGFSVVSSTPLDSRVSGYKSCVYGNYNKEKIGYFIDGMIDAASVNTQILTVSAAGQIQNPLLKDGKTDSQNVHKPTLLSQDINGDGIYEVPHQQAVTGYENVPESEKIYKTIWKQLYNGELKKSSVMYMNNALGIKIMYPQRLEGITTIKPIMAQNELVFYEYGGSLEKSTTPLFSIRVSEKELYEWQEGYEILCSNEYSIVTVKLYDEDNKLCPTWEELFSIVDIM